MHRFGKAQALIPAVAGPRDFAAAFDVSRETLDRLETYAALLRHWQKAVNLVARGTLETVWLRHFADSAQLLPLVPPGSHHWIDLGSGAGFPGLVIAILLAETPSPRAAPTSPSSPSARGEGRGEGQKQDPATFGTAPHPNPLPIEEWGEGTPPPSRVTLVESDTRKASFLREVARQTGLTAGMSQSVAVDVLSIRAESARIRVNDSLPRVICARALAPLDKLLALAAPLSPPGTVGLWCKGKSIASELQTAEKTWKFNVELVPSVTDRDGRIAVITNLERKAKD